MFEWRIAKYNPQYRDATGAYLKDEWTSYSDVGQIFNGHLLTIEEYLTIEKTYIKAIIVFMECLNIYALKVTDLEQEGLRCKAVHGIENLIRISNGEWIDKEKMHIVIQLILRNSIWCKLESPEMFVHFGYDYYMYVGSTELCMLALQLIKQSGLFIESFKSPY